MKKRITSLLICGLLGIGAIAGCGGTNDSDAVKLTVWGSASQESTLNEMVEEFKKANPEKKYDIKVGICEEDMAYSIVGKDPSAAADVFCYSNDQLIPLLRVGALVRIGGNYLETIKQNNSADSVASGSVRYGTDKEEVYGYPYTDNGCFLVYDKSVVTDEQATTLEGIIEACESKNKEIGWPLDVPWYTAGWFFTFGCEYSVEYDYDKNYKETEVRLEGFNGEAGIKASKAMAILADSKALYGKNIKNSTITDNFNAGKMAVAVTGPWLAKSLQTKLGENYGVSKLPTVTVDGETVQIKSFEGYKLIGVNSHCATPAEAHKLAQFLSSEAMQKVRFEKHLMGPTNNSVAALDMVKNDVTVKALKSQNASAVEQVSVPANFWEPVKSYGLNILDKLLNETGTGGKLTYKQQLDTMVNLMKSSIN